ncbi:ATP-binding protein [Microbacterium sp. BWT-B31]|uniref:sensor histidine kinase n=1 Tax=Microbacterium sp. BWT-B31 TaxID=3232072 RepID=UPI003529872C
MTDAAPHRWSLQARLMATVIGIVSLILLIVATATGTALWRVLQEDLDSQLFAAATQAGHALVVPLFPPGTEHTAERVLIEGRQPAGFLFVVRTPSGATDGAVVGEDYGVDTLTGAQVEEVVRAVRPGDFATVSVDDLGEYRVVGVRAGAYSAVAGMPLAEVQRTIGQMLLTVLLVTLGGLLVLAAAIALVIRTGLTPLRAIADTATRVAAVPMSEGAVSITERVPKDEIDGHTEIGRVGSALNTLLDHVDTALTVRQRNEERMRRFVADASHELRTPLASIRGYSELSLRAIAQQGAAPAQDTTETSLERIQAQSLRMTRLVEDLLLLARLDEGQELVYSEVDLSRLAIDSVGDARAAHPDHQWRIDVGESPVVVAGDAARLSQVAANLLANAGIHTPAGTGIAVTVTREGAEAVFRVRDSGPGIDPEVMPELFERFSRADRSRARKTGGTGLGLSIARAIAQAHGGSLTARSAPGDTVFELRLPAKPAAPAAS